MTSKFQQLQTKAAQIAQFATKNGGSHCKELMEKNKSKFQQSQTKAAEIAESVTKNGGSYYKELMEKNKLYIQEPPSIETCQLLSNQLFYTRLASIPGRYGAFWKELDSLKQFLKTKEAWNLENASMASLIGVECFAWFCGGEIIGRGFTITGYYV
ncbi:hypothetical protein DITRI_Ditri02bG0082300 [Diplodiscus trichospermus]